VQSLHDDQDRAEDDTRYASTQNRVGNNGQCLVHDHVGQQECHQKEVTILADGLDFSSVKLLQTAA
jgi:hypothetical protein